MKLVQKNPVADIMEIRQTGISVSAVEGMPDALALTFKGRTAEGKIKRWSLCFDSFAELDALQEQLAALRPFAGQVSDLQRTLLREGI